MLSYIGGKSKIAPKLIVPNIPKDIETYIEPFGGMFWCFFSMKLNEFPNLKNVIYNDLNPLNYNLFRCLSDPDTLCYEMNQIPVQQVNKKNDVEMLKSLFNSFQQTIFDPEFKIEGIDYKTAAKYVYVVTQVFSGSRPETSSYIDLKGKYKSKYLTFRDKLNNDKWRTYFSKINMVKNDDFTKIVDDYNDVSSYFYFDPPYWKTENYYSKHNFKIDDHKRLSDVLKNIKGRFSLSYYEFEELSQFYPKNKYRWVSQRFSKPAAAKKNMKQNQSEEILIMNY